MMWKLHADMSLVDSALASVVESADGPKSVLKFYAAVKVLHEKQILLLLKEAKEANPNFGGMYGSTGGVSYNDGEPCTLGCDFESTLEVESLLPERDMWLWATHKGIDYEGDYGYVNVKGFSKWKELRQLVELYFEIHHRCDEETNVALMFDGTVYEEDAE